MTWNYSTYFSSLLDNEFKMIACEAYNEDIISKMSTTIPHPIYFITQTRYAMLYIYACVEIKKARCTITKETQKTQRHVMF